MASLVLGSEHVHLSCEGLEWRIEMLEDGLGRENVLLHMANPMKDYQCLVKQTCILWTSILKFCSWFSTTLRSGQRLSQSNTLICFDWNHLLSALGVYSGEQKVSFRRSPKMFFFLAWLVLSSLHLLIRYDQLPDPCSPQHDFIYHVLSCTLSFLVFYLYQTISLIFIWSKQFLLLVYCVPRPL